MSSHRFVTFTSPRDRVFLELLRELRGLYLADLKALLDHAKKLAQKRQDQQAEQPPIALHDDPHGA